jgi:hypothetical protein
MDAFYALLLKIKEKPGMYIGSPSINDLFFFLCGYQHARHEQQLDPTPGEQAFYEFQGWLQERYQIRSSASWAKIILLYSTSDAQGFELFYQLFNEFLVTKGHQPLFTTPAGQPVYLTSSLL